MYGVEKMNKKKLLSVILASVFIVSSFAGCSSKQVENTTSAATEVIEKTETTTQAPTLEDEIISFTVTDKDGNILTLVPIFDKDASTVVAGYIMSATDKSGKELTAKVYSLLNSVVSVTSNDGKLTLDTDSKGGLISVETYSDTDGNLIAIKDVKDVNANKNTDEFLKLTSVKDSNEITQYVIEYTVVTITKDKKSQKVYVNEGNKKSEVKIVDSSNTAAAGRVKKDTENNEQTVTKETDDSENSNNSDKPGESTGSDEKNPATPAVSEDDYINIVLQKNRAAKCSSSNVAISTGQVNINKGGNYKITSETDDWHGQIVLQLDNTENCELRFEDVYISNDTKNIIQIIDKSITSDRTFLEAEADTDSSASNEIKDVSDNDSAPNVDISFPEGTSSTFTTSANSYTGVLYNESKLTIKGNGSATFAATKNANNCICSTKSISIKNVSLTLTTAQNTSTESLAKVSGSAKGIFSYSKVTVDSGKLTVKSNGDCVRCDSFYLNGGTADFKSSACDGIDADDSIVISGGSITSIATQKYCYKVRRVNNTEEFLVKGRVRAGKDDCFRINGGTVIGEGFRISSLSSAFQSDKKDSAQASVTAKIVKKGTAEASKTPAVIKINTLNKSSSNKVTKFLYSSSSVKKGTAYTATANGKSAAVTWNGNFGVAEIETTSNV